MTRGWLRRGALAVLVLGLLAAGAEWKLHLLDQLQTKLPGNNAVKLAAVVSDRLRKEGLAATVEAITDRLGGPAQSDKILYSVLDPAQVPAPESAAERAALPEFKRIPAADPATLAPSRDADLRYDNWHRSHGNDQSSKFSSHAQINRANVAQLAVAWVNHSGQDLGDPKALGTTVQTNPVVAGGHLFIGGEQHLRSIDAATGKEVWRLELPGPVARRGLAWAPGPGGPTDFAQSRLYVPTSQGVFAVRAASGQVATDFGDQGRVGGELSLIAPLVMNGQLIIAIARPAVEAYDLKTGKLLWTTALLDKKEARRGTLYGGIPWAGMSGDAARGMVFVATGNARPQMVGSARVGDNRNTCSVVALDATTGVIRWVFQEVVHDLWDLDVPSPPVLTSITRGGKRVDVVATVTKIGNTLLLDRDSGKPIFDFRLRRAPTSGIPGERTAAYQPAVELPVPFAKLVFEKDDITDLSEASRDTVLRKIGKGKMGYFEPPMLGSPVVAWGLQGGGEWPGAAADPRSGVLYVPSNQLPWLVRAHFLNNQLTPELAAKVPGDSRYQAACASCHGASGEGRYETERQGDAHFPVLNGITVLRSREALTSKAVFDEQHRGAQLPQAVTVAELQTLYAYLRRLDEDADKAHAFTHTGFWQVLLDDQGRPGSKPPWGYLTAIDLNTGQHAWRVPFGQYDKLTRNGQPVQGQRNHGGVIATAGGLVFATGTLDNRLRAFDAANGRELWSYALPAAGSTPPSTYLIDGVQYLVVVAGGGQHVEFSGRSDQIIAFRLPPAAR